MQHNPGCYENCSPHIKKFFFETFGLRYFHMKRLIGNARYGLKFYGTQLCDLYRQEQRL